MSARHLLISLAVGALGACSPPTEGPPEVLPDSGKGYFPGADWRTISPASAGLDPSKLDALGRDLSKEHYGTVDGVVIVRYGFVVFEQYHNWSRDARHTMQSVSKSVTSLVYGIARAEYPTELSLDRPVLDAFANYSTVANVDAQKQSLTFRHLLTMRTSMDFWEQPYAGSPLDVLNRSSGDWVKYVLDRPMVGAPGTTWAYNSGAAIVICGAIRRVTGSSIQAYAMTKLFAPIGITDAQWAFSPYDGLAHCGGGLNLRAIDLARVGYLVLRGGQWNGNTIVPADWLSASTAVDSHGPPVFFSDFGSSYGYFWWLFPSQRGGAGADVISASGSGGQWLFVVPSLDLVVAVVATNGDGLDMLYDGILPAIRPQ